MSVPVDGDVARPLELLTRGSISRKMIDKELSYFLPAGTPALVHKSEVRGSRLEPKTRWGIAIGMLGSQVMFRCPFIHSQFISKSFTAFKLKDGMSYTSFLGLPELDGVQGEAVIRTDHSKSVVNIDLDKVKDIQPKHIPPVKLVWHASEHGVGACPPEEAGIGLEQGIAPPPPRKGERGVVRVLGKDGKCITPLPGTYELVQNDPDTSYQLTADEARPRGYMVSGGSDLLAVDPMKESNAIPKNAGQKVTDAHTRPAVPDKDSDSEASRDETQKTGPTTGRVIPEVTVSIEKCKVTK